MLRPDRFKTRAPNSDEEIELRGQTDLFWRLLDNGKTAERR
jgi:hypothetical protein